MSKELEVKNLQISFRTNNGTVKAVRDISFDLEKGETLCIVGESGSGKSVTAKAAIGILAGNSIVEGGEILYDGMDLLKLSDEEFDKIRGNKITMIFQDPLSSLDPIVKIGKQMIEATLLNNKTNIKNAKKRLKAETISLKKKMKEAGLGEKETALVDDFAKNGDVNEYFKEAVAKTLGSEASSEYIEKLQSIYYDKTHKITKQMAKEKAIQIMEDVGIKEAEKRFDQYPFEFSGGMRQRIVIAIAIAANPDILICDEPTTALDVTIQAQIMELINDIKKKRRLSVIFITHDLGVVANMADKVAVMYAGKIVEYGTADDIFYSPAHPYTWALLASMPDLDTKDKLEAIPGTPPNMIFPPKGDAFAERNKYAMKIDFEQQPPMFKISDTHSAATWLLHPDAPKVDPPKSVTDRIKRMKELEASANE
jgi:oligopeptide transport system ATP-binding protein